jgi:MFS transporter, FHS family, L-fucose permease
MIIAVQSNVYVGMLLGLFIVALGFSLQQTAANPFAILLGDPKTGASRVNLGGGGNSFGTTIGPIIVALALFGSAKSLTDEQIQLLELNKVILMYTCVGLLFIAAAVLFYFSKKVPSGISIEPIEKANKALKVLLVMTGMLIVFFSPVFASYNSKEVKEMSVLENQVKVSKGIIKSYKDTLTHLNLLRKNNDSMSQQASISKVISIIEKLDKQEIQVKELNEKIEIIRLPIEKERMYWLFGALMVVVFGLLYAYLSAQKKPEGWGAMQYPQLVLGMLAIFTYVGVEVAIGSNLGELLKKPEFGGFSSSEIAPYISMYWGS